MKLTITLISLLMITSILCTEAQSQISSSQIKHLYVEPLPEQGVVRVSWVTSFDATEQQLTATLINGDAQTSVVRGKKPEEIKLLEGSLKISGGIVIEAAYFTDFAWGKALFDEQLRSLELKIQAKSPSGEVVFRESEATPSAIIGAFKLYSSLKDAQVKPPVQMPKFLRLTVEKTTRKSIEVEAESDKLFLAKAYAFRTDNPASVLDTTQPAGTSDEQLFQPGKTTVFRIKELTPGEKYVIQIREEKPPPIGIRSRAISEFRATDKNGSPLMTKPRIDPPIVSYATPDKKPINIKNQKVEIPVNLTQAKRLEIELLEWDGTKYIATGIKKSDLPGSPFDTEANKVYTLSKDFPLQEGKRYEIKVVAFNGFQEEEEVDRSEAGESGEFSGLKVKLFENLQIDVSGQNLKVVPTGTSELLNIDGNVLVGSRFKVPMKCTSGNNPACLIDASIPNFFSQLEPSTEAGAKAGDQADLTATPIADGQVRGVIRFELTVSAADKSQRSQTQSVEMTITAPDKKKEGLGKKFASFVNGVLTQKEDGNISGKQLRGSGIGGFLSMLLRLFL